MEAKEIYPNTFEVGPERFVVNAKSEEEAIAIVNAAIEAQNTPADESDLTTVKNYTRAQITNSATGARAQVAHRADQYKLAGWADKAQRALRVLTDAGSDIDLEILQIECDRRGLGETPKELVEKQAIKAQALAKSVAAIDGVEAAALANIATKRSKEKLLELLRETRSELESY